MSTKTPNLKAVHYRDSSDKMEYSVSIYRHEALAAAALDIAAIEQTHAAAIEAARRDERRKCFEEVRDMTIEQIPKWGRAWLVWDWVRKWAIHKLSVATEAAPPAAEGTKQP
jgi:hypothetical protein